MWIDELRYAAEPITDAAPADTTPPTAPATLAAADHAERQNHEHRRIKLHSANDNSGSLLNERCKDQPRAKNDAAEHGNWGCRWVETYQGGWASYVHE